MNINNNYLLFYHVLFDQLDYHLFEVTDAISRVIETAYVRSYKQIWWKHHATVIQSTKYWLRCHSDDNWNRSCQIRFFLFPWFWKIIPPVLFIWAWYKLLLLFGGDNMRASRYLSDLNSSSPTISSILWQSSLKRSLLIRKYRRNWRSVKSSANSAHLWRCRDLLWREWIWLIWLRHSIGAMISVIIDSSLCMSWWWCNNDNEPITTAVVATTKSLSIGVEEGGDITRSRRDDMMRIVVNMEMDSMDEGTEGWLAIGEMKS